MLSHGHRSNRAISPTYYSWKAMKQRCDCSSHSFFESYGARGITYADGWEDFENFLRDMGERPEGMTLDRKDPDKNYSKENCRWATAEEQANNKRNTRRITSCGKTLSVSQWADLLGIPRSTISSRLSSGWSADEALFGKRSNIAA